MNDTPSKAPGGSSLQQQQHSSRVVVARELRHVVRMAEELLLARPSDASIRSYYDKFKAPQEGAELRVQPIGGDLGKGLFADRDFEKDDLILREPSLVGAQHTSNKADALVCSFCFQYIGSIELQIGRRLLPPGDDRRLTDSTHFRSDESRDGASSTVVGDHQENGLIARHEPSDKSSSPMEKDRTSEQGLNGVGGEEEGGLEDEDCGCSDDDSEDVKKAVPIELVSALLKGDLRLPESDLLPLPPVLNCPGGCEDALFCGDTCAANAWDNYHSLLCTGSGSHCRDRDSLIKFKEFADETNDIFHVAAQVISRTILQAKRLKNQRWGVEKRMKTKDIEHEEGGVDEVLLEAWEPFAMSHKKLWWEAVALPADVLPAEENAFRTQIKDLASQSLTYLKGAIYEEAFSPLFSLEVYGHIIGMFEQNNLEIVVPSPVEDYFIYIDDLPPLAKAKADSITRPFLDALGSGYAAYCQGSGFFALQSCINHSCWPNAKAFKRDEDRDGHAVITATRSIKKGEEIIISYIAEDADIDERRAMLADYGFVCSCPRCIEEGYQSL